MLPGKLLVIGVTASALMIVGCAKKENSSVSNLSKTSGNEATSQANSSKSAQSDDIFNEFYKDENTGSQKEKLNAKETFTPSGASSSSSSSESYSAGFSATGRYVLQISTVLSESFANKLKNKLENAGYPAYVAEVQNPTPSLSGTYYRVRIGAFSSISAAKEFGENVLKSLGYDYWIDNKANDLVGINGGSFGNSGSSYSSDSYSPSTSTPAYSPAPAASEWSSPPSQTSGSSSNSSSTSPSTSESYTPATSSSTTTAAPAVEEPVRKIPAESATQKPSSSSSSSTTAKDTAGWGTNGW